MRIANCSGFYGDRLAAAREMVDGGPIDVLTGDYLAELTMLILAKAQAKDPGAGYARTFLTQMEEVLGTCLERGIKIVSNAGGLNPAGLARRRVGGARADAASPTSRATTCAAPSTPITPPGRGQAGVGQRLPRRLGHRRGARGGRRRRRHRAGHRRLARRRARGVVARLERRRLGRARRRGRRRATSSSAARRPPAATTRSSTRSPTARTRASRSPRSPPTARR